MKAKHIKKSNGTYQDLFAYISKILIIFLKFRFLL